MATLTLPPMASLPPLFCAPSMPTFPTMRSYRITDDSKCHVTMPVFSLSQGWRSLRASATVKEVDNFLVSFLSQEPRTYDITRCDIPPFLSAVVMQDGCLVEIAFEITPVDSGSLIVCKRFFGDARAFESYFSDLCVLFGIESKSHRRPAPVEACCWMPELVEMLASHHLQQVRDSAEMILGLAGGLSIEYLTENPSDARELFVYVCKALLRRDVIDPIVSTYVTLALTTWFRSGVVTSNQQSCGWLIPTDLQQELRKSLGAVVADHEHQYVKTIECARQLMLLL